VWHKPAGLEEFGTCLASFIDTTESSQPDLGLSNEPGDFVPIPHARWSTTEEGGQTTYFSLPFVDNSSLESCTDMPCARSPSCGAGFYPVLDEPCYTSPDLQEFRILRCCRMQVNWNGFLLGFEERGHMLQGTLQHTSCCTPCSNGQYSSGCTALSGGECLDCPTGRYNNDNVPGRNPRTSCFQCEPCPAGFYRANCARANPGVCLPCEDGDVKTAGLEGSWADTCERCPSCPRGSERIECTATETGRCQHCGNGQFDAGYCRDCDTCTEGARTGCGGSRLGVCALCAPGVNYRSNDRCERCETCPDQNGISTVRVGCAGESPGECYRLEASLPQMPQPCFSAAGTLSAACPGATLPLQWVLHGIDGVALAAGSGDCTATGVCAVGLWHAALYHRSSGNPAGDEVVRLMEGTPEDMDFEAVADSGDSSYNATTGVTLPTDLQDGAGYFIRIFFEEFGAAASFQLTADSEDFAVAGEAAILQAQLAEAEDALSSGDRAGAAAHYTQICNQGAAGLLEVQIACQRSKAMTMGLLDRGVPAATLSLPHSSEAPAARAEAAATQVMQAEPLLHMWENLTTFYLQVFPSDLASWQASVDETRGATPVDDGNLTNVSETTTDPPEQVYTLAHLAVLAETVATGLAEQKAEWKDEIDYVADALRVSLSELKTLDTSFARAAEAVGFRLAGMAQGVVQHLWDSLQIEPPQASRRPWFAEAMDTIGASCVLLIGSWSASWDHDTAWGLHAELGDVDAWLSQALASDESFGNSAPPSTAPPMTTTIKRLWTHFRSVAQLWLARWQTELDSIGDPATVNMTAIADKAALAMELLDFVEDVTQEVLEPLRREQAELLRGSLPTVRGCSADGLCLRQAMQLFPESAAAAAMAHGLRSNLRSWVSNAENSEYLGRIAAELAPLGLRRAVLLERVLLQMLDLRDLWGEYNTLEVHVAAATEAERLLMVASGLARRLTSTAGDSDPAAADSEWRFEQIWRNLQPAALSGLPSIRHMAYRRLRRFEQLASHTIDNIVLYYPIPWDPLTGSSSELSASINEAVTALGNYLDSLIIRTPTATGQILYSATALTSPTLFAALEADNVALLNLAPADGLAALKVRSEARAFLVAPSSTAFAINDQTSTTAQSPPSVPVQGEFIELELRRLPAGVESLDGEAQFTTRQQRTRCESLDASGAPQDIMWLQADGVWLLNVRDGPTHSPIEIDEGSQLMIFFTVEVPSGDPPWPLIAGQSGSLFRLPFRGDCEMVTDILDPAPTVSTSSHAPTSSSTEMPTTTDVFEPPGTTTRVVPTFFPPIGDDDDSAPPAASDEAGDSGLDIPMQLIIWPSALVVLLGLAFCGWFVWRSYQMQKSSRIAAVAEYEADVMAGQEYYQHQAEYQQQLQNYQLYMQQYQAQQLQQQMLALPAPPQTGFPLVSPMQPPMLALPAPTTVVAATPGPPPTPPPGGAHNHGGRSPRQLPMTPSPASPPPTADGKIRPGTAGMSAPRPPLLALPAPPTSSQPLVRASSDGGDSSYSSRSGSLSRATSRSAKWLDAGTPEAASSRSLQSATRRSGTFDGTTPRDDQTPRAACEVEGGPSGDEPASTRASQHEAESEAITAASVEEPAAALLPPPVEQPPFKADDDDELSSAAPAAGAQAEAPQAPLESRSTSKVLESPLDIPAEAEKAPIAAPQDDADELEAVESEQPAPVPVTESETPAEASASPAESGDKVPPADQRQEEAAKAQDEMVTPAETLPEAAEEPPRPAVGIAVASPTLARGTSPAFGEGSMSSTASPTNKSAERQRSPTAAQPEASPPLASQQEEAASAPPAAPAAPLPPPPPPPPPKSRPSSGNPAHLLQTGASKQDLAPPPPPPPPRPKAPGPEVDTVAAPTDTVRTAPPSPSSEQPPKASAPVKGVSPAAKARMNLQRRAGPAPVEGSGSAATSPSPTHRGTMARSPTGSQSIACLSRSGTTVTERPELRPSVPPAPPPQPPASPSSRNG